MKTFLNVLLLSTSLLAATQLAGVAQNSPPSEEALKACNSAAPSPDWASRYGEVVFQARCIPTKGEPSWSWSSVPIIKTSSPEESERFLERKASFWRGKVAYFQQDRDRNGRIDYFLYYFNRRWRLIAVGSPSKKMYFHSSPPPSSS